MTLNKPRCCHVTLPIHTIQDKCLGRQATCTHPALLPVQIELMLHHSHGPDAFRQLWGAGKPGVDVHVAGAKCSTTHGHSERAIKQNKEKKTMNKAQQHWNKQQSAERNGQCSSRYVNRSLKLLSNIRKPAQEKFPKLFISL